MQLLINEELREIDAGSLTIDALLGLLGIEERRGVAVAVNARVVPKSRWSETEVADGDAIEVIRATQGG